MFTYVMTTNESGYSLYLHSLYVILYMKIYSVLKKKNRKYYWANLVETTKVFSLISCKHHSSETIVDNLSYVRRHTH